MALSPRLCPACKQVSMLLFGDDKLEIDSCPECFGLWFDGEELRQFLPSQSLAEKILSQDRMEQMLRSQPRDPGHERICPQCSIAMRESPVGAVQVDVCFRCRGIWLDQGELSRLLEQYKVGDRGNLVVLNQIAEGLREVRRRPGETI